MVGLVGHTILRQTDATMFNQVGGQVVNVVLIIGEVVGHLPVQVLGNDWADSSHDLDTGIVEFTNVAVHLCTEVGTCGNVDVVDQVCGLAVVPVSTEAEAVVQERDVETYIIGRRLLPRQLRIVNAGAYRLTIAEEGIVSVVVVSRESGDVIEVANASKVLLTGLTISQTDFQVADSVVVAQESFFFHTPGKGGGREVAPLMSLRKA